MTTVGALDQKQQHRLSLDQWQTARAGDRHREPRHYQRFVAGDQSGASGSAPASPHLVRSIIGNRNGTASPTIDGRQNVQVMGIASHGITNGSQLEISPAPAIRPGSPHLVRSIIGNRNGTASPTIDGRQNVQVMGIASHGITNGSQLEISPAPAIRPGSPHLVRSIIGNRNGTCSPTIDGRPHVQVIGIDRHGITNGSQLETRPATATAPAHQRSMADRMCR